MIKLLDCTLRDGGYINNWCFGKKAIAEIKEKLEDSNIEIIELGFLKDEPEDGNRTIYKSVEQLNPIIREKKKNTLYAAMIDVQGRIPIDMISDFTPGTIDIIRVIVWKRLLKEDLAYCKKIVEKGYKLCVQPARVDQYSDSEFVDMLKMFECLNPLAMYVVDSWGTQSIESIMHYINLANDTLNNNIAIGYHGHNNLQQAFGIAESFIDKDMQRDKIIDASIYGIGRGAGNLGTEVISLFMNKKLNKGYNQKNIVEMYDKYIKNIFTQNPWGFSMPLYITALNNCNPEYGMYCAKHNMSNMQILQILSSLTGEDKVRYNEELISELIENK